MSSITTIELPDGTTFSLSDWGNYPIFSRTWERRTHTWHEHLKGATYPLLDYMNHPEGKKVFYVLGYKAFTMPRSVRSHYKRYTKKGYHADTDTDRPTLLRRVRTRLHLEKYGKYPDHGDGDDSTGVGMFNLFGD